MIEPFQEEAFKFEGTDVSVLVGGSGFPLLLIHGSGPGASSIGNWGAVLAPLAEKFQVYAMDLIGFGRSGRKATAPYFDFKLWLCQSQAMMDRMPAGPLGIIGHSVSAAIALKLAAESDRVSGVLATGAMGLPFPVNPATERIWSFPRDRTELIAAAKTLIFDERLIDEAYLTNRERVLRTSDYQTYFSAMFGGDKQRFIDATVITDEEFARIRCPVTLLHGREDQGFPANALSLAIIEKLPQATLTLIAACGHSVAMEHPKKFLAAADDIFPLMRAVQEAAS